MARGAASRAFPCLGNWGQRLTGELGVGGSYNWGGGRSTLSTEAAGDTALTDFGEGYNLKGAAGLRMRCWPARRGRSHAPLALWRELQEG